MLRTDSPEIDGRLAIFRAGDRDVLRGLMPFLYEELRRVARQQLRPTPCAHTPQTTALVYEAYLRLDHQFRGQFQNRDHFICHMRVADAAEPCRL